MFTTHQKCEIGMLAVQRRALELDCIVSKPTMETRYDLVLDDGKKLYRVQVKYSGEEKNGAVTVDLITECRNNGRFKFYTDSEIDVVIVYLPATGKCYWLTPKEFNKVGSISLRLEPTKNKQQKNVRFAKDFEW